LKEICNDTEIENEVLYGTTKTSALTYKLWVAANNATNVEMNEHGATRRYVEMFLHSKFDFDAEHDDEAKKLYSRRTKTLVKRYQR